MVSWRIVEESMISRHCRQTYVRHELVAAFGLWMRVKNPTKSRNIESLDVQYGVVDDFKRQAKHPLGNSVDQVSK